MTFVERCFGDLQGRRYLVEQERAKPWQRKSSMTVPAKALQ